ncbi:unnamed protein product [Rotaria magnacalcarata]|uniref:Uncharacterized protein n=1 Tax=Rotaria magnacalcarata TaxID=392030 RepID=A0A816MC51_9BILA|nr:unnamed protein product [Rotaria magnacalcarata]CAF4043165.1 unnamed protein product [Rotaria magnacalcarata]CAF4162033.1 unnamed protein product [Rotaria magnacalcarata]
MPQRHSFTFYINTYIDTDGLSHDLSREHIQQELINIGQQMCLLSSIILIVFNYVTYLVVDDEDAFRHEFFVRIARSFPILKYLCIFNNEPQASGDLTLSSDHIQSFSIIEYPHLTSLDVSNRDKDHLEQFLNETKACVPCRTELEVSHRDLKTVTKNFTTEETRRNCAK